MISRRTIVENVSKRGQADAHFNQRFWDSVGAEGRFAAMWEMVGEASLLRAKEAAGRPQDLLDLEKLKSSGNDRGN